jgi:hypothetical protein
MRDRSIRVPWAALAVAILAGSVATPLMGAAAWQGLQLETGVPVDVKQARAEVTLDIAPSAFTFDPVVVTVEDNAKKAKKTIGLEIGLRNNSDRDYYAYLTATLVDADGKSIVAKSEKEKADDDDHATVHLKFKLTYAEAERVKSCKLSIAFEKE